MKKTTINRTAKMAKALLLLKEFLKTVTIPIQKLKPLNDAIDEALK